MGRFVANSNCRKALLEDVQRHRRKEKLESAQRRSTLNKCRRDLLDHTILLSALLKENGTLTFFVVKRVDR